jgi:phosphatidylglycerol lysyltransferase
MDFGPDSERRDDGKNKNRSMSTPVSRSEALFSPTGDESPVQAFPPGDKGRPLRRPAWTIVMLAWLVRLSALLNLLSSLLPYKPKFIHWLVPWVPFEISDGTRLRMFLTSLLLFILASGLARGKRTAWLLTIGTLAIAPILHLGYVPLWPQMLINLGLIVFLLLHHRHFVVRSDRQSVRSALLICSILAVALLVFGTIRLHDLVDETSGGDNWGSCLQTAIELVLSQNAHAQAPQTITSSNFFVFLRVGGITIALVGLFLTLRPALKQRQIIGAYRGRVQGLIDQYGKDPYDSYALLDDKSYFFSADNQVVVPYVLSGNFAVALADPIGSTAARPAAIVDFALFCHQQDWEPVFYAITLEMAAVYEQAGFSLFKIGEGARLHTADFHLKGGDFQNLRTICNKAHKMGVQFRWYNAEQGIDEALEHQLASISQRWLEAKKAREMSFDMGAYSLDDIRKNGAAVAVDATGKPLAFAVWRSFAQGGGRALDLMRALPHARNIMDFVLVESIAHFRSCGVSEINLGLAPLANTTGATTQLVAEEKMVQFLFENLNHIYGYKSLFEFKRKYRPDWQGRYVAYRRGVNLPLVGLALVRVHAPGGIWKFLVG